jgi:hypothetical protein
MILLIINAKLQQIHAFLQKLIGLMMVELAKKNAQNTTLLTPPLQLGRNVSLSLLIHAGLMVKRSSEETENVLPHAQFTKRRTHPQRNV